MLDELAEQLGLRAEIAAVTERAMRGELDFEEALTARVGKLAGLGVGALETAAGAMTLDPGAEILVATMRAQGAVTALVSGGFSFFTERVQALCGFDRQQANTLLVEDGKLTGEVARPILGREAKLSCLEALCAELVISPAEVCAVGDGANDLAMLEAAGLGVAYHAKPLVRRAARARLDHADLTGLLYLQGYRQRDFAASS
jgi:phosphoserine phosphatase